MLVVDGVERRESYAVYSLARRSGKMRAPADAVNASRAAHVHIDSTSESFAPRPRSPLTARVAPRICCVSFPLASLDDSITARWTPAS